MQHDSNEFVFIRKRKRLPVTDAQDAEAVGPPDEALHLGLIPEVAVLPEPTASSPTSPDNSEPDLILNAPSDFLVTVEKFLRRSVQAALRAKQGRKSRAYTHRPTKRIRKVAKVPKRSLVRESRIANMLFRAAVLADGDPLDSLVDDAGISLTRRPLKFVPFNKFATSLEDGEAKPVEPSHLGRGEDKTVHARRHGNASDLKYNSHARVPLTLVPLHEAEAAYSVMFP